jgi:hypothetical protein
LPSSFSNTTVMALCAVCHRSSTDIYNCEFGLLRLQNAHNASLCTRHFGDRAGMAADRQVCSLCCQYVCPRTPKDHNTPSWSYAWPAVLWSCLSKQHLNADAVALMQFLPYDLRASWAPSVNQWLPAMRDALQMEPRFEDVTRVRQTFQADIDSGELPRLMKALDDTCFPQVRCPMGCYMYVDDEVGNKLQLLPASHYLCTLMPSFTAFHAQAQYFNGARDDWTCPITDLDWKVAPSLIVDKDHGLCILTCSTKQHSDGRKPFFHVPTHPIIGCTAPQAPDYLAPAVVTANVVRSGTSNRYNTSFPVFRQQGNTGGLSTLRLATRHPSFRMTDNLTVCSGFTLAERSDILHYAIQAEHFESNAILDTLQRYQHEKPTDQTIAACATSATFMDVHDACLLNYAFNTQTGVDDDMPQQQDGQAVDEAKPRKKVSDCLFIVHPNNTTGHKPFPVLRGHEIGANHELPMTWLLCGVLQCLLHVRLMHTQLLYRLWQQPNQQLHRQLVDVCKAFGNNTHVTHTPVKAQTLNEISTALSALPQALVTEQALADILQYLCPGIESRPINDDWQFPATDTVDTGLLVLTRPGRLRGQEHVPLQSPNSDWKLLFGLSIERLALGYHVEVCFRWTPAFHWQYTGTRQHDRPSSQMRLLIYGTDTKLQEAREDVLKRCGGQSKIVCLLHGDYLLRQQKGCAILCCVPRCKTGIRWCCSHGVGHVQCTVGLCLHHFKLYILNPQDTPIAIAMYGPEPQQGRAQVLPVLDGNLPDEDDAVEEILALTVNDTDAQDIPCHPLERYAIGANNYGCPDITSSTVDAAFLSESSSHGTLGHYLLNNHLQVLNRSTKSQKPPVAAQKILQQICARTPEWTVPLIYPESQLFPRIFWNMHENAVTGALPAIMFTNAGTHAQCPTASLTDHMYVRLMDASLLTSRESGYLQFIFDVLLNSVLNTNSATVACRKGLEHLTRNHSTQSIDTRESIMQLDELDSRREVKRLAALLRSEGAWHYFITLTCNDSATMGVWPIRAAIDRRFDSLNRDAMLQNYAVIMCRAWERTSRYVWEYIQFSPERPLGHVKCAWMRYEFQSAGALGNRPHVHGGITLHPESEQVSLQRISCSLRDMFSVTTHTDMSTLMKVGVVNNESEFARLRNLANQLQTHSCTNAAGRCQKRAADGSMICRVQKHPASFTCTFDEKEDLYDAETMDRLQYLDLGETDPLTQKWKPAREYRGGRWRYPAQPDEHFVPTAGLLFTALQACTNLQYCDRKFQLAYVAKYAAGYDEKCHVTLTSTAKDSQTIDAEVQQPIHIKITGQAMKASKAHRNALAREISLPEMIWFCARLPYIRYPTHMTHVSTMPPEYRAAIIKRHSAVSRVEGDGGHLHPVEARCHLPVWRQFTASQELAMTDFARGSYYLDTTTGFSLRPPELLIFNNLEQYAKWFVFKTMPAKHQYVADDTLPNCLWIDAGFRRVHLRHAYVIAACEYILSKQDHPDTGDQAQHLQNGIFQSLQHEHNAHHLDRNYSEMYLRFVDVTKTKQNVVVFTQVTPTQFSRFLIHLMLSTGHFLTEIDLYSAPSMLHAFHMSGLLRNAIPTEEDVKRIARNYVQGQLQWLAIGTRRFSRLLQALIDGLQRFLLHGEVAYDSLPLYLQRAMVENATQEVTDLQQTRRTMAVDTLFHELANVIPNFPDPQALKEQQMTPFNPRITPIPDQSQESIAEQTAALQDCCMAIDQLFLPDTTFAKSPVLVGPPGSGKTHILLLSQIYALSHGLNAQLVAMTSERARRLGGEHIHLLFGMPVIEEKRHTISSMAESTIFRLQRTPVRMAALQRIDVLLIEEIGLVSAEMFAVMDVVLRYIRDNQVPMGGVLILASGDPRQLTPVSGTPIWASYHLIATFRVTSLVHYVRAQRDVNLQTLLRHLRRGNVTDAEIAEFESILREHCIPDHCVLGWHQVPPHVLRIVGTRQASKEIVQEYLRLKVSDPAITCTTFLATDEVETAGGQVMQANDATTKQLNYKCQEPHSLIVFVGAVMRLTYNNIHPTQSCPRFSQGQLCVVCSLHKDDQTPASNKITLKLVPPGLRNFEVDNLPVEWAEFSIKIRSSSPIVLRLSRSRAWRKQFPLTYFVCSTIHKAIGETLPHVATQLSLTHKQYRLWEREQLLVLLSRVPTLNDITFVTTDPEDTIAAMLNLLALPSHWASHVDNVLQSLDCRYAGPRILQHVRNPLPGMLHLIPDVNLGFVYLIGSTKECRFAYVGETACIRRRLIQHNSGHGSMFTNDPLLRPWGLMVLVSGFPGAGHDANNITARKAFEAQWHFRNAILPPTDVRGMMASGQAVFAIARQQNAQLVWQEFATVRVVEA